MLIDVDSVLSNKTNLHYARIAYHGYKAWLYRNDGVVRPEFEDISVEEKLAFEVAWQVVVKAIKAEAMMKHWIG